MPNFRFPAGAAAAAVLASLPGMAAAQSASQPAATSAATSAERTGDVRAGVDAWEAGDYPGAVALWRPIAIAGDADAQFNLAQAYKLGRGVAQDLAVAADWYRRAASQGHVPGADNLGLVLYELGRREDALPWLDRSASRGEPRAQYVLAAELFNGERMSRDWPRAYALMKRASDAGLQRASAGLVQMDQHIPLEQRQQGIALAASMDTSEAQARTTAMVAPAPAPVAAGPVRPGTSYDPPPLDGRPAAAATAQPRPQPRLAPAPVPAPAPATVTAARPAPHAPALSGHWGVQLGAFSARDRAERLWQQLEGRMGAATPAYVAGNGVVRLRATGYASRAAAEQTCAAIRPQPCFVVAP